MKSFVFSSLATQSPNWRSFLQQERSSAPWHPPVTGDALHQCHTSLLVNSLSLLCHRLFPQAIDFSHHVLTIDEQRNTIDFELRHRGEISSLPLRKGLVSGALRQKGTTLFGTHRNNPFIRFQNSETFSALKRDLCATLHELDKTPPQTSERPSTNQKSTTLFHFFTHETESPSLFEMSQQEEVLNARVHIHLPKIYFLSEFQARKLFQCIRRDLPPSEDFFGYLASLPDDRAVIDSFMAIVNTGTDENQPYGLFEESRATLLRRIEATSGVGFIQGRHEIRVLHCFAMAVCICLHYRRYGGHLSNLRANVFCPQRVHC